jgi:heat shock protein HslJ
MNYRFTIISFLLLFTFNQCNQNKEASEGQQKDFIINNDSWVLSDWVKDDTSKMIAAEIPITLNFDQQNNKLSGNSGCNQYFGNYTLDDDNFKAGPMGSTMMFCSEAIMAQEQQFLSLLESGMILSIENDFLILKKDNNQFTFKPIQN